MCGIAGYWADAPGRREDRLEAVRRMADTLKHRGPDDSGAWTEDDIGVALGFRRLSIIELTKAGHQPMASADGRFMIVFNGEIYNHNVLRPKLESRGIQFRGRSDTEVLCNAFSVWGIEATLRRCEGMFAIAVWDRTERVLTLARDRLGIKPLYVHWEPGFISFGSEMKALIAGPQFSRALSPESVDAFLRYLYVPAPASIFKATFKLKQGHLLHVRDPSSSLPESTPYWSLNEAYLSRQGDRVQMSEDEAISRLDSVITGAVRSHLEADVSVGAFLSGGIDSSAVVALATKATPTPVRTFSVAFDEREHDESTHAAAIARHLQTEHTSIRLSSDAALAIVPSLGGIYDEPFADPSQIPALLVCRAAREHVAVALSGDGGDELFAGYNRYGYGATVAQSVLGIPTSWRKLASSVLAYPRTSAWDRVYAGVSPFLPPSRRERLVGEKIAKLAKVLRAESSADLFDRLVSMWPPEAALVTGQIDAADRFTAPYAAQSSNLEGLDLIEQMLLADQLGSLADDQLAKVDRASMAVSLEVRVPLLDHRVVEESWSIPMHLKVAGGVPKHILRRLAYRHIPQDLLDRPKMGFSVPISSWLRGPLKPWALELLDQRIPELDELLFREPINDAWKRLQSGDDSRGLGLWAVLMLRQWGLRWLS